MKALSSHVRRNLVAYLALFVALGGTGYAAANLPANSVGSHQLINGSISAKKLDRKSIAASIRAWVNVQWRGSTLVAVASSSRVRLVTVSDADAISWPHRRFPRNCMPSVTPQVNFTDPARFNGYVTAQFDPRNRTGATLNLFGFGPDGSSRAQAADVMIVCPTP